MKLTGANLIDIYSGFFLNISKSCLNLFHKLNFFFVSLVTTDSNHCNKAVFIFIPPLYWNNFVSLNYRLVVVVWAVLQNLDILLEGTTVFIDLKILMEFLMIFKV